MRNLPMSAYNIQGPGEVISHAWFSLHAAAKMLRRELAANAQQLPVTIPSPGWAVNMGPCSPTGSHPVKPTQTPVVF